PLSELPPLERVRAGRVVRGLRDSEGLSGDADPPPVERRHRDPEPLALLVQEPVALDDRALDDDVVRARGVQSEFLLAPGPPDLIAAEDAGADTAGPRRLGVGRSGAADRARAP